MMRRLVLVIFCLLIQGTSLCYGQQTIYIYIVPPHLGWTNCAGLCKEKYKSEMGSY